MSAIPFQQDANPKLAEFILVELTPILQNLFAFATTTTLKVEGAYTELPIVSGIAEVASTAQTAQTRRSKLSSNIKTNSTLSNARSIPLPPNPSANSFRFSPGSIVEINGGGGGFTFVAGGFTNQYSNSSTSCDNVPIELKGGYTYMSDVGIVAMPNARTGLTFIGGSFAPIDNVDLNQPCQCSGLTFISGGFTMSAQGMTFVSGRIAPIISTNRQCNKTVGHSVRRTTTNNTTVVAGCTDCAQSNNSNNNTNKSRARLAQNQSLRHQVDIDQAQQNLYDGAIHRIVFSTNVSKCNLYTFDAAIGISFFTAPTGTTGVSGFKCYYKEPHCHQEVCQPLCNNNNSTSNSSTSGTTICGFSIPFLSSSSSSSTSGMTGCHEKVPKKDRRYDCEFDRECFHRQKMDMCQCNHQMHEPNIDNCRKYNCQCPMSSSCHCRKKERLVWRWFSNGQGTGGRSEDLDPISLYLFDVLSDNLKAQLSLESWKRLFLIGNFTLVESVAFENTAVPPVPIGEIAVYSFIFTDGCLTYYAAIEVTTEVLDYAQTRSTCPCPRRRHEDCEEEEEIITTTNAASNNNTLIIAASAFAGLAFLFSATCLWHPHNRCNWCYDDHDDEVECIVKEERIFEPVCEPAPRCEPAPCKPKRHKKSHKPKRCTKRYDDCNDQPCNDRRIRRYDDCNDQSYSSGSHFIFDDEDECSDLW